MNHIETIARGVCIKEGNILLAYFKEKEYYFLPGGHVEFGESIGKTLEREMLEETGLSAMAKDLILVFEHTWHNKTKLVHEMNYVLMYELDSPPEIVSATVPHLEFAWVSPKEFEDIVFLPKEIKEYVSSALKGDTTLRFFSTMGS
ncbi:MAG: NUDIX domain-containing protein [Minisyncoccota bacterium]